MAARQRKLKVGRQGYDDVSAKSLFELYPNSTKSDGSDCDMGGFGTWVARFFSFSGMYATPTFSAIIYAFLMEFIGAFLLGSAVAIASYFVAGLNVILAGLAVGAVYGGAYYAATRLPADHSLRRHLNGAITFGYLIVSRIGLFGALFYMIAQLCGSLLAGIVVGQALLPYATAAAPIVQATVPLPTILISSFATVFCLELFGAALIVFTLLLSEFAGTDENKAADNFHKAATNAAFVIVVLVVIGFPFQVYTYNNVTYFGGLFANVFNTVPGREINGLAALYDPVRHAGSVFGPAGTGHGGAWALYYFLPHLGGVLGALIFLAIFMSRFGGETYPIPSGLDDRKNRNPVTMADVPNAVLKAAAIQSPVSALVSPFLKTH